MITLRGLEEKYYPAEFAARLKRERQEARRERWDGLRRDFRWWWYDWGVSLFVVLPIQLVYWAGIYSLGWKLWCAMYFAYALLHNGMQG